RIYTESAGAQEPDNAAMSESIAAWLELNNGPASTRYEFNRIDLNGDTRSNALVMLKNPYGQWCDMNGCTILVLRANEKTFSPVGTIRSVRGPIFISKLRTNNWNDLIVRVDGRWSETKDVAMKFDGSKYPEDPEPLPPVRHYAELNGQRIFP